ncbi:MAG: tetratricopeptide repeat protein [Chloroflexi bacterium]|nr:tetratricopeptide repeat protein [Chloroflexota bacterium]
MLYLRLLGPPLIERDGQPLPPFKSRKVLALLAYLALSPGAHARSELAGLLWSDCAEKQALNYLRFALWDLHRILGDCGIKSGRTSVSFEAHPGVGLDVNLWRDFLAGVELDGLELTAEQVVVWQRGIDLYRGELLAGLDLPGDLLFCDWLERERAIYRERIVNALYRVANYHAAQRRLAQAIAATRRLLVLDPWREEAHRQLMILLARSGQRSAALAQFEICRRVLAAELGVPPSPRTTAWYERIRAAETTRAHDVPAPLTEFVGREQELARIAALLANPACRLLTLVGPGGIGKTRLALQAATHRADDFLHGARFVPLAALEAPDLLLPTLAAHLDFSFGGAGDPKSQLFNFLRGKEMLLVLDNFDRLSSRAGLLLEILQSAPEVKILITSRARLNVQAEWLCDVAGLRAEGARLFLANARRVGADLDMNTEHAAIARICELVAGLPLGIELAAAWVREYSCAQIAQQVERNLGFLATTQDDVPEKHRSLYAAFEYSWEMLSAAEQAAFRRLAVFRGGWSAPAAEAVVGTSRALLGLLIEKSLVRRAAADRYEMLEVLRHFGEEKLRAAAQEEATRAAHGEYFARFLAARQEPLKGRGQKTALAEIGAEIDNVRAAWQWAVEQKNADALGRALDALFLFYEGRNWFAEGEQAFQRAVEQVGALDPGGPTFARLMTRQGVLAFRLAQYNRARDLLQRGLGLLRARDDRAEIAFTLTNLANVYERQGDAARARELQREGLALARELGDPWAIGRALNNLGYLLQLAGETVEPERLLQQALAIRRKIDDRAGIARTLINLGLVASEARKFARARDYYSEGLPIFRELENPLGAAICLNNLGYVAFRLDEYAEAKQLYLEGLKIRQELGDPWGIALAYDNLGAAATRTDDLAEAGDYFDQALQIAAEIHATRRLVEILVGVAGLLAKQHARPRAVELLGLALNHQAISEDSRRIAQELLAALRVQLDEEPIAAALAKGQASDLLQLVGEIRQELHRTGE